MPVRKAIVEKDGVFDGAIPAVTGRPKTCRL